MAGATFPIITKRVGEGGQTNGTEAFRIQQLLKMAGFTKVGTPDGDFGKNSRTALMDFHSALKIGPVVPYIEPKDAWDSLFALALMAKTLIPMPSNLRSVSALNCLYDYCRSAGITYGWFKDGEPIGGGTRMIWGFENRPNWAISTLPGSQGKAKFSTSMPITLNCTGFSNLALSAWMQGNAHAAPYDASQAVGGTVSLGERYGLLPASNTTVYESAEDIKAVAEPDRIYHFAICRKDGFMTHDTVYYNGMIYECNSDRTPAVYSSTLEERWKRIRSAGKRARLYGPGAF